VTQVNQDIIEGKRNEINLINESIKRLLLRRWELSWQIAQAKREKGTPIFDPQRESEMLDQILDQESLSAEQINALTNVFQAIFKESRRLQSFAKGSTCADP
jgi:chorismate mutase